MISQLDFRRTPITLTLAAIIVAVELFCTFSDLTQQLGDEAIRRNAVYNEAITDDIGFGLLPRMWYKHQYWLPMTTSLLHGGLIHAAFNLYWLLLWGPFLEKRFGWWRFLALTVLLAYTSNILSFCITNASLFGYTEWMPPAIAAWVPKEEGLIGQLGFSGVIYGYFGMLWIGRRYDQGIRWVLPDQTVKLLLGWLVLCFFLTRAGIMPVANAAHVLGLLTGAVYGLAIYDFHRRYAWRAAAVVLTILLILPMLIVPPYIRPLM